MKTETVRVFAFSYSFALTHTNAESMEEKLQPKEKVQSYILHCYSWQTSFSRLQFLANH